MAKSPTEQIRELTSDLRVFETRVDTLLDDIKDLIATDEKRREDVAELRDSHALFQRQVGEEHARLAAELRLLTDRDARRVAELAERKAADEKRQSEITELRRELAEFRQENAVLRQQLQDHIKQVELWDGRRWGLIVLLLGAVLSLASGLIVTLAKK